MERNTEIYDYIDRGCAEILHLSECAKIEVEMNDANSCSLIYTLISEMYAVMRLRKKLESIINIEDINFFVQNGQLATLFGGLVTKNDRYYGPSIVRSKENIRFVIDRVTKGYATQNVNSNVDNLINSTKDKNKEGIKRGYRYVNGIISCEDEKIKDLGDLEVMLYATMGNLETIKSLSIKIYSMLTGKFNKEYIDETKIDQKLREIIEERYKNYKTDKEISNYYESDSTDDYYKKIDKLKFGRALLQGKISTNRLYGMLGDKVSDYNITKKEMYISYWKEGYYTMYSIEELCEVIMYNMINDGLQKIEEQIEKNAPALDPYFELSNDFEYNKVYKDDFENRMKQYISDNILPYDKKHKKHIDKIAALYRARLVLFEDSLNPSEFSRMFGKYKENIRRQTNVKDIDKTYNDKTLEERRTIYNDECREIRRDTSNMVLVIENTTLEAKEGESDKGR